MATNSTTFSHLSSLDERTANGHKFGQRHHRAKLTDEEVDQIHWLREQGLTYAAIALKWDDDKTLSPSTVRDICSGRIRSAHSDSKRTIEATTRLRAKNAL